MSKKCPVSKKSGTTCPMSRNNDPDFVLPDYTPLDPDNLPTQAEHGVLGQLDGVWVSKPGAYGIHTTIMPAPGTSSEQMFGAYHFITQEYTEEWKFTKKNGAVRNRLGSNEQFVGSVNYEQTIHDRNGAEIHNEVGQFLWLGVWTSKGAAPYGDSMYSRKATEADVTYDMTHPTLKADAQGPQFIPPFSISRQGSIPHGNSIQLFGSQPKDDDTGAPLKDIPFAPEIYPGANEGVTWADGCTSFHPSMGYTAEKLNQITNPEQPHLGKREKPKFAEYCTPETYMPSVEAEPQLLDPNSGEAYMGRVFNGAQKLKKPGHQDPTEMDPLFPYCVQPNFKLVDNNKDLLRDGYEIVSHDTFTLNSQMNGALGSLQGVQGGSLNTTSTQRYCTVKNVKFTMWINKVKHRSGEMHDELQYEQVILFEFGFGSDGTKTLWPHIQVNTLVRKSTPLADESEANGKRSRRSA